MDANLLLQIAGILVAARVFEELAARFNAPRVIGELCAGIVLGPSLLGWIHPSDPIKLLAEIGIVLLLFEIGLETDLGRIIRAGPRAMLLAVVGFVAPFVLGTGLAYYTFDLPLLISLFVGGTLTATSIGITVRVLTDLGRHRSNESQIVIGAAVVDDILGVILLAVLYELSVSGAVSVVNAGRVVLYVTAFFLVAPIAAKMLAYAVQRYEAKSRTPGIIPVALIAIILTLAAIAHNVGAPGLLGGFAAGIALSRRFFLPFGLTLRVGPGFNRKIREQIKPISQLLTPIFFVVVGLSLDLSAVDWSSPFIWFFSIAMTVVAIVGKIAGGLVVPENPYTRVAIGLAMVPRGEVGLIFAELGRISGILDNEVYAGVVIVVAYTTLLSPFWIKLYYRLYADRFVNGD